MAKARKPAIDALFGREREVAALEEISGSGRAEFFAIYGRRRVGKTYLIRQFFRQRAAPYFEFTGQKDASLEVQLGNFREALETTFYGSRRIPPLDSWSNAFKTLSAALETEPAPNEAARAVVFLDELPWMAVPKSGLIQALDHIWNTQLSKRRQIILIVCGSAASWIINNLIQAKGGLHNRVTRQMRLLSFTLPQTRDYLAASKVKIGLRPAIELYMAIGGVPHYLNQVERKLSVAQNIAKLCFSETGMLRTEFTRLFASLFGESEAYEKIVRSLATRREGIRREELLESLRAESGGSINRRLKELEEAGFIVRLTPYNKRTRDAAYRIIDPYVYFYLSWIDKAPSGAFAGAGEKFWLQKIRTPAYLAWGGYTFENLCLTHFNLIEQALGLTHVASAVGSWRYSPPKKTAGQRGAQVDLLFDRDDGVISICEIKFSTEPFSITKAYAKELKDKLEAFASVTRTRKDLRLVLITSAGFKPNTWSEGLVDIALDAETLFGR